MLLPHTGLPHFPPQNRVRSRWEMPGSPASGTFFFPLSLRPSWTPAQRQWTISTMSNLRKENIFVSSCWWEIENPPLTDPIGVIFRYDKIYRPGCVISAVTFQNGWHSGQRYWWGRHWGSLQERCHVNYEDHLVLGVRRRIPEASRIFFLHGVLLH